MTCKFCRTENESINHLLLECNGLLNVRGMTDELLRAANSSFQKNRILRMENISSIPEAIVISKYKGTIWNVRNALKRGAKHNEERTAEKVRMNKDSHLRRMQATINPHSTDSPVNLRFNIKQIIIAINNLICTPRIHDWYCADIFG